MTTPTPEELATTIIGDAAGARQKDRTSMKITVHCWPMEPATGLVLRDQPQTRTVDTGDVECVSEHIDFMPGKLAVRLADGAVLVVRKDATAPEAYDLLRARA